MSGALPTGTARGWGKRPRRTASWPMLPQLGGDTSAEDLESQRLAALRRYRILDSEREAAFDRITALAANLLDAPISLITLVDESRQWFKSAHGLEAGWTRREGGFCTYTVSCRTNALVEDASTDALFATHPMVTGPPHIRLYAGAPLITSDGHALGTLCVIDSVPRRLDEREMRILESLAGIVMDLIENRLLGMRLVDEEAVRLRTELELESAAQQAELLRLHVQRTETLEHVKRDFLSAASHELRTPLSVLGGYLEMVSDPAFSTMPDATERAYEIMRTKVAEIDNLVERMLMVARVEKTPREAEEFDLRTLLEGETRRAWASGGRNIELQLPAEPALVRGDPLRLGVVFENLFENAIRFSGPGSRIGCRVTAEVGRVVVEVWDHGVGVAGEDIAHILSPFGRHSLAESSLPQGPGLGLYLVRQLVDAHGGTVEFTSTRGEGSRVTVTLPIRHRRRARTNGTGANEALSEREQEVARLVAEGLTNQAIAGRLFLGPSTVASHVAHVLAKLNFRSRAQIAGWVAELDRENQPIKG